MIDSTINGNSSGSAGGGIRQNAANLEVVNSTLSGNRARRQGGGISSDNLSLLTVAYTTLSDNTAGGAGGGVADADTAVSTQILTGTLLAGNVARAGKPDCDGTFTSGGDNLLGDGAGCLLWPSGGHAGDEVGQEPALLDPHLGPLASNGGPTQTMVLLPGSPAIDHGGTLAAGCPATDQRGVSRPQGAACDIGAYEFIP